MAELTKQELKKIELIAIDVLDMETLETRMSDRLDFIELPVWAIQEALAKAFELGKQS